MQKFPMLPALPFEKERGIENIFNSSFALQDGLEPTTP